MSNFDVNMGKYRISLDVVRRANGRIGRRSRSIEGNIAKGEVVVRIGSGKRFVISNSQIKAAYKKAIDVVNAKAV